MATQTFPKSYLLERIDARLASLARQDVEDTKIVAEWRSGQEKRLRKWVKETIEAAVRLPDRLMEIAEKEIGKDWDSLDKGSTHIRNLLTSGWPNRPGEMYQPYGTPGRAERENASSANERLRKRATERDALSHTRAYLTDTPVEEFSTTMLGRLGLLDAVKFNLDQAQAEAQAAAKKGRR